MRKQAVAVLKAVAPSLVYEVREFRHRSQTKKDVGETASIFQEIYDRNMWGGEPGVPYSGSGSDDVVTAPFVDIVRGYVKEHAIQSIADLGCGDFRVGKQLADSGTDYTGIDVVPSLIKAHQDKFGNERTRFFSGDITKDTLPDADLYIVRQVLQHLDNQQILRVLEKLALKSHVIIAEHHPDPQRLRHRNVDKAPGRGTRIGHRSGVFPESAPFNQVYRIIGTTQVKIIAAPGERVTVYAKI